MVDNANAETTDWAEQAKNAKEILEFAKDEATALDDFLRTLTPTDWAKETALAPWKVEDVVAHLDVVGAAYLEAARSGAEGSHPTTTSTPAPRGPRPVQTILDFRAEMVAEAADRRATLGTTDEVRAGFRQTYDALFECMEGLSISEWNKRTSLSFGGEMPVYRLAGVALSELALHSWDIRSALVPNAELSLPSQRVLSVNALTRLFRVVDASDFPSVGPEPVRYRFRVEGHADRTHDVVVEHGTARGELATPDEAQVEFKMHASDFVLVFYKRLNLDQLITEERIVVDGESRLVSAFDAWMERKVLP